MNSSTASACCLCQSVRPGACSGSLSVQSKEREGATHLAVLSVVAYDAWEVGSALIVPVCSLSFLTA